MLDAWTFLTCYTFNLMGIKKVFVGFSSGRTIHIDSPLQPNGLCKDDHGENQCIVPKDTYFF